MIKYTRLYTVIAALLLLSFSFSACQKDEVDPGGTAVQEVAGQWWVKVNGPGFPANTYFPILTYNTAENVATTMWLDDEGAGYGLKAKVSVDGAAKTFTATSADELYYGVKVSVTGKVISGGATAPGSKTKTDSIYFEAKFSDDPTSTYKYSGYRRTKFAEDDH